MPHWVLAKITRIFEHHYINTKLSIGKSFQKFVDWSIVESEESVKFL